MSTSCQIAFFEVNPHEYYNDPTHKIFKQERHSALIYKHCDGYPRVPDYPRIGMVPLLLPFLELFNERRGLGDAEYCSAWCMWHLIDSHIEQLSPRYPQDAKDCLGHGITKNLLRGIEYFYAVYPDTLEVWSTSDWDNWKLLETIEIK